ncbi:MAG TPA: ABC transporter permease [Streptosporangiaceae bacterium]|nr:ABC transporter permease [Streptosporangiaceae bacterium]
MRPADLLRTGVIGIRARRLRAALSVLGIAIGIAAIVCVMGISQSSAADLQHRLDGLGTNLLTVQPGNNLVGASTALPLPAEQMVTRARYVQQVSAVANVTGAVLRNRLINPYLTGGIEIKAARPNLLPVLRGGVAHGGFLNTATSHFPVVVLGAVAAQRLGVGTGTTLWLGGPSSGHWFTVAGVLAPLSLAPDIDRSALIGFDIAQRMFSTDGSATTVYLRADPAHVAEAADTVGTQADPAHPDQVTVSQPSAALSAQLAAKNSFNSLFLGLGGVAVLVGAIGIANVMVISVLERRSEIGLRRALGATRPHIAVQFLTESLVLALLGGLVGSAIGSLVTAGYAAYENWQIVIPAAALGMGIGGTLVIGALAGLYPATRAALLPPTEALSS